MKANKALVLSHIALAATSSLLVTTLITFLNSRRAAGTASSATEPASFQGVNSNGFGVDPAAPASILVERGSKASWSPDGRHILFNDRGSLHVFDLQGRTMRSLDEDGSDPAWSPSGSWIACVRRGAYGTNNSYLNEEVWLVPAKEGAARRLARGGFPNWSTDGRFLYVHSRANHQILEFNAADFEAPAVVFYERTPSYYFSVAPDGSQVAFGSRNQLEIRDRATGTVVRQWPTPGHRGLLPAWSPDGRVVAFGGFNGTQLGVWLLQVVTGRAVRVREGRFTMPAWSTDGRWLAFDERVSGRNSIWLVGRPHLDQLLEGASAASPRNP